MWVIEKCAALRNVTPGSAPTSIERFEVGGDLRGYRGSSRISWPTWSTMVHHGPTISFSPFWNLQTGTASPEFCHEDHEGNRKKWPLTRNVFSRIKMSRHRFACAHIIWRNRTQTRMLQPAFFFLESEHRHHDFNGIKPARTWMWAVSSVWNLGKEWHDQSASF